MAIEGPEILHLNGWIMIKIIIIKQGSKVKLFQRGALPKIFASELISDKKLNTLNILDLCRVV